MGLVVCRIAKGFNDQSRIEISTAMQGNVVFKETVDVYMNAHFKGTLEFCGTLTVGEHAELEADIRGDIVIVSGRVYGNITAHKLLVLMPTAVVLWKYRGPETEHRGRRGSPGELPDDRGPAGHHRSVAVP